MNQSLYAQNFVCFHNLFSWNKLLPQVKRYEYFSKVPNTHCQIVFQNNCLIDILTYL